MKSTAYIWITVCGMLLVGLIATYAPAAEVITKTEKVTLYGVEIEAVKTADNFIVLFNSAKTMGKPYKKTGMSHLEVVGHGGPRSERIRSGRRMPPTSLTESRFLVPIHTHGR